LFWRETNNSKNYIETEELQLLVLQARDENRDKTPGAIEAFIVLSRSAQVPARLRVLVFVLGELFRDIFAWRCGYAAEASVEFDGRACFWLKYRKKSGAIEISGKTDNMGELRVLALVLHFRI
jgi:hypothetical protein